MTDSFERPDHYEYYLLGGVTPIRVAFDKTGLVMGAEVPDPARPGSLCWDNTYLSRLREGDHVETIDRLAFERHVGAVAKAAGGL